MATNIVIAIAAFSFIVAVVLACQVARRKIPKSYAVINALAWSIEGLAWAAFFGAAVYLWVTGRLPGQ